MCANAAAKERATGAATYQHLSQGAAGIHAQQGCRATELPRGRARRGRRWRDLPHR